MDVTVALLNSTTFEALLERWASLVRAGTSKGLLLYQPIIGYDVAFSGFPWPCCVSRRAFDSYLRR